MWQHKHIGIPVGTLVGLTLIVVFVGNTELVETFVDGLVVVSITISTHKSNSSASVRYRYMYTYIHSYTLYKHTYVP